MKWSRPQQRVSRALQRIDEFTSHTSAALLAMTAVIVFTLLSALDRFPLNWQTGFSALVSAITLVMLFVIQHTQSRHQMALQLKLDELIRASPRADDQLVRIEVADVEELDQRAKDQQKLHESLREGDSLEIIEHPRPKGV